MRIFPAVLIFSFVLLSIIGSGSAGKKGRKAGGKGRTVHKPHPGRGRSFGGSGGGFSSSFQQQQSQQSSQSSSSSSHVSRWVDPSIYQQNAQDVSQQINQVQEMKQDFSQRWSGQQQEWRGEEQKLNGLEQKIQQNDPSILQTYRQEKQSYVQAEQSFQQQKQTVQSKLDNVQNVLVDLKDKNAQVLQQAQQGTADVQQAKDLLSEYRQKQQEVVRDLPAALAEAQNAEQGHGGMRQKVNQWTQGYLQNPVLSGGGGGDNNWDQWLDADYWEKHHEEMWGGFEQFFGKWQNWVNDPNSGNYKLANRRWGAFDNGEFNLEKSSDEFFGPDHVANDPLHGNYTDDSGWASGNAAQQAMDGGAAAFGANSQFGSGGGGGGSGGGNDNVLISSVITHLREHAKSIIDHLEQEFFATMKAFKANQPNGGQCCACSGGAVPSRNPTGYQSLDYHEIPPFNPMG